MLEEGVGTQQESDYSPDVQIREVSRAITHSPLDARLCESLAGQGTYQDAGLMLGRQVDFDPRLVNSVGVLGNLGQPFTLRRLPGGKVVATSTVAVRNAKRETDWCAPLLTRFHHSTPCTALVSALTYPGTRQVQPGGVEPARGAGVIPGQGHPGPGELPRLQWRAWQQSLCFLAPPAQAHKCFQPRNWHPWAAEGWRTLERTYDGGAYTGNAADQGGGDKQTHLAASARSASSAHACMQVVGRLKTESYTDRATGQPRKSFKIVADQINRVRPYAAPVRGGRSCVCNLGGSCAVLCRLPLACMILSVRQSSHVRQPREAKAARGTTVQAVLLSSGPVVISCRAPAVLHAGVRRRAGAGRAGGGRGAAGAAAAAAAGAAAVGGGVSAGGAALLRRGAAVLLRRDARGRAGVACAVTRSAPAVPFPQSGMLLCMPARA